MRNRTEQRNRGIRAAWLGVCILAMSIAHTAIPPQNTLPGLMPGPAPACPAPPAFPPAGGHRSPSQRQGGDSVPGHSAPAAIGPHVLTPIPTERYGSATLPVPHPKPGLELLDGGGGRIDSAFFPQSPHTSGPAGAGSP